MVMYFRTGMGLYPGLLYHGVWGYHCLDGYHDGFSSISRQLQAFLISTKIPFHQKHLKGIYKPLFFPTLYPNNLPSQS